MTGFGSADGLVGGVRVSVEVRSVNHRFFTPTIKIPSVFSKWEGEVREILRKRVLRGHVNLFARIGADAPESAPLIDEVKLSRYLTELKGIKSRHGISGELDIATVLRLPNLMGLPAEEADTGTVEEFSS